MQQSATTLCIGLLIPSTFTAPAIAQTATPTSVAPAPTGKAADLQVQPRFGAGFFTTGAGYSEPYFTIEGFTPLQQNPGQDLTFFEGRLLVSTDSALGGNLLFGKRFYNAAQNQILGGYLAYDLRDTGNAVFHQLGAGFERLGNWDLRVNAYLPIGDRRQSLESSFSNPRFQQNLLILDARNRAEAAMAGIDIEAGGRLISLGQGDLRGYAGVYYYDAPGSDSIVGIRGRLEARPTDNLQLGLTLQHDPLFETRLILGLKASLSGNRPSGVQPDTVLARLGESVARTNPITVDEQEDTTTIAATNPKTGQPWQFRHVSLGTGTGDGTFETPTSTVQAGLAVAQPEDIVYVQFSQNPGIDALTIPDGVSVLSTAPVQKIDTEQLGIIQLPSSGSGQYPTVNGTVTMGNDTTLAGFALNNVSGNGIQGGGVQNITIRDNFIVNSSRQGISLTEVSGKNIIRNNEIANNGEQGIFIQNSNSTQQELLLDRNLIHDNQRQGIFLQASDSAQQQVTLSQNSIDRNKLQGIFAQANGDGKQTLAIANTTIRQTAQDGNGNGGQGLFLAANDGAQQSTQLLNLQVTENGSQGIFLQGNGALTSAPTQQRLTSENILVDNNTGAGIFVQANGNVQQAVNLQQNTISQTRSDSNGNGGQGVFIAGNGGSQQTIQLNSTTIANSAAQGMFIQGNGDPTNPTIQTRQSITNTNATVQNSTGTGIFVQANGNVQQQMTIANTTITNTSPDQGGNGGQGLFIAAGGGAQQTFSLEEVVSNNNAVQGIFVQANGDPANPATLTQQNFTMNNAQVSNNVGAGVFVQANGNVQQAFTIENSTIQNTALDNGGNGGQGIFIQANGNAQSRYTLRNNVIANNADTGIFIQANESSQMIANVQANQLLNNSTPGLNAAMNSNQRVCVDLNRNDSNTGYLLQRNTGTFQVVDRDAVNSNNNGTVNFQPAIANFETVTACP
jgi:trimeric autotransporter adhesin